MSINTNVNALRALRRLDEAGSARERTFERLASGSRINRASDDADAGRLKVLFVTRHHVRPVPQGGRRDQPPEGRRSADLHTV